MGIVDHIMQIDASRWICDKLNELPERAKFCAASALRSLQWASANYDANMPIPASYFALHATEEAVAAFICCAKICGYGDDAKINLRDHRAKATVSLMAQKVSNLLQPYQVAIGVHPESDQLIARFTVDGEICYNEASTKLVYLIDRDAVDQRKDFLSEIVAEFGDIAALKKAVLDGQEARNRILYATKDGLPTGFLNPAAALRRECKLTLALLWAAIDVIRNRDTPIEFIAQALRTANMIIADMNSKKLNLFYRLCIGA